MIAELYRRIYHSAAYTGRGPDEIVVTHESNGFAVWVLNYESGACSQPEPKLVRYHSGQVMHAREDAIEFAVRYVDLAVENDPAAI